MSFSSIIRLYLLVASACIWHAQAADQTPAANNLQAPLAVPLGIYTNGADGFKTETIVICEDGRGFLFGGVGGGQMIWRHRENDVIEVMHLRRDDLYPDKYVPTRPLIMRVGDRQLIHADEKEVRARASIGTPLVLVDDPVPEQLLQMIADTTVPDWPQEEQRIATEPTRTSTE